MLAIALCFTTLIVSAPLHLLLACCPPAVFCTRQVTIATALAGRGTDILLGGNPKGLVQMLLENRLLERLAGPGACLIVLLAACLCCSAAQSADAVGQMAAGGWRSRIAAALGRCLLRLPPLARR